MALSSSVAATAAGDAAGSSSSSSDVPPSSRFPADFYLYTYKVAPCSVTGPHEWSTCPFWHPGERARRRDPTRFSYEPLLCPDDKKGVSCPRGDACPYTHHVYEYWLHPKRFRTLMCQQVGGRGALLLLYSTAQHSTAQYSTAQRSTTHLAGGAALHSLLSFLCLLH